MQSAKKIAVDKALSLLKQGHELQQPGKDLNTLRYIKEQNHYSYEGVNDQAPTTFSEDEVKDLIKSKNWLVDEW